MAEEGVLSRLAHRWLNHIAGGDFRPAGVLVLMITILVNEGHWVNGESRTQQVPHCMGSPAAITLASRYHQRKATASEGMSTL